LNGYEEEESGAGGVYKLKHREPVSGLADLDHPDDGEEDGLKNLQKRWFDNMKEYLERKAVRIATKQRAREQQEALAKEREWTLIGFYK